MSRASVSDTRYPDLEKLFFTVRGKEVCKLLTSTVAESPPLLSWLSTNTHINCGFNFIIFIGYVSVKSTGTTLSLS